MEPARTANEYITKTCARECGNGEMSVRGMGVRVVVAVVASNGKRVKGEDTIAKSCGGDPTANHMDDRASSMGDRNSAPIGETEHQWYSATPLPHNKRYT